MKNLFGGNLWKFHFRLPVSARLGTCSTYAGYISFYRVSHKILNTFFSCSWPQFRHQIATDGVSAISIKIWDKGKIQILVRLKICSGKYQFWWIIVSEMWFSKIFSQQILHIEMRAKRVVTIFTARLALKAIEKHKRKCFCALKMAPVPTYLVNISNL